jgi:hypothetical protein
MTITINEWYIFVPILSVLMYLTFKNYPSWGGSGYIRLDGLPNLFWGFITVVFILIWGGIFWW